VIRHPPGNVPETAPQDRLVDLGELPGQGGVAFRAEHVAHVLEGISETMDRLVEDEGVSSPKQRLEATVPGSVFRG
jgi:hypothetical protein